MWLLQVRADDADRSCNCGTASGYTFTLEASVIDARMETISAPMQASELYQNNQQMSNVDRTETTARHCEQLAQVLFASQHLFPKSPLRKTHLRTESYTNLFGLENNLSAAKANSVFELYQQLREMFEGQ